MKDLIIIGAGGHSAVVADAAIRAGYNIVGFIDDHAPNAPLPGYRILGPVSSLINSQSNSRLVVAIGDNRTRKKIVDILNLPLCCYATIIDPSATVSSYASISQGVVILQGAIINARTVVGSHTILNTGCTVDHDCTISDYAHISPGVNLAGGVSINEGAHIGIGACVVPGCVIGKYSIVGAGAAVINDIPNEVIAIGVPARVNKSHSID